MAVWAAYAPEEKSERALRKLERSFAKRGLPLLRDSGSLAAFQQHLEQAQCAVLLISDAFLHSQHCMAELLALETQPELRRRCFPILLPDARLEKAIERLVYINAWDRQCQLLTRAGSERALELEQANRIRTCFGRLPALLKEMQTRTLAQQAEDNFYSLSQVIAQRCAQEQEPH